MVIQKFLSVALFVQKYNAESSKRYLKFLIIPEKISILKTILSPTLQTCLGFFNLDLHALTFKFKDSVRFLELINLNST